MKILPQLKKKNDFLYKVQNIVKSKDKSFHCVRSFLKHIMRTCLVNDLDASHDLTINVTTHKPSNLQPLKSL